MHNRENHFTARMRNPSNRWWSYDGMWRFGAARHDPIQVETDLQNGRLYAAFSSIVVAIIDLEDSSLPNRIFLLGTLPFHFYHGIHLVACISKKKIVATMGLCSRVSYASIPSIPHVVHRV
jgi:hypothetical protein